MAAVHPSINDQITRVQLRLLKQKLESEQERLNKLAGQDKESLIEDRFNRLEEAVKHREELLDKLRRERQLSEELNRPSSFPRLPTVNHRTRPQGHRQSIRRTESQPQFNDADSRYLPATSGRFNQLDASPAGVHYQQPQRPLPPPQQLPALPAVLPPIIQQPYVMAPFSQPHEPVQSNSNTRSDMYEMMMIQNAQMHQIIMQQLMMAALPRPANQSQSNVPVNPPAQPSTKFTIDINDLINLKKANSVADPAPAAVHHHHYGPAPGDGQTASVPHLQQPTASHNSGYPYTMPPIQVMPAGQPYIATDPIDNSDHPSHLHRNYHQQHLPDGNNVSA